MHCKIDVSVISPLDQGELNLKQLEGGVLKVSPVDFGKNQFQYLVTLPSSQSLSFSFSSQGLDFQMLFMHLKHAGYSK